MELNIPFTNPLTGAPDSIKLTFNAARKNDPATGDRATLGAEIELPMNLVTLVPTLLGSYYMMWKMSGGMDSVLDPVGKLHDSMVELLSDDSAIEQISNSLQALDRESMKKLLSKSRQQENTPEKRLRTATLRIALAKMLTDEQSIAAAHGIRNTLPEKTRTVFNSAVPAGKTIGEQILARKKLVQNATPQELADIMLEENAYFPTDALVDAAYEITQKGTPEALKTLISHFVNTVSEDDLKAIALTGFNTVDSVLEATSNGNFSDTGLKDGLNEVHQHFKGVLQALEDSFVEAGMTPDTDLTEPLKNWAEMMELVSRKPPNKGPGNSNKGPNI